MGCSVALDASGRFLDMTYGGVVSAPEMAVAVRRALELAVEHDTWAVLTDCAALISGPAVLDLYSLVEALAHLEALPRYREAIVRPVDPVAAESVRFWETAAVNRGLQSRTFADRARAVAWLAG